MNAFTLAAVTVCKRIADANVRSLRKDRDLAGRARAIRKLLDTRIDLETVDAILDICQSICERDCGTLTMAIETTLKEVRRDLVKSFRTVAA